MSDPSITRDDDDTEGHGIHHTGYHEQPPSEADDDTEGHGIHHTGYHEQPPSEADDDVAGHIHGKVARSSDADER
jgi:hypothetical protein